MMDAWLAQGKRISDTVQTPSDRPEKQGRSETPEKAFSLSKAEKWVQSDEFSDQLLSVKSTHVFCLACCTQLGHEARLLRQHCFQAQNSGARSQFAEKEETEKLKLRHYKKMKQWHAKENERKLLMQSTSFFVPFPGAANDDITAGMNSRRLWLSHNFINLSSSI